MSSRLAEPTMMLRRLNEDRRPRSSLLPSMAIKRAPFYSSGSAPHAGSVSFFRSNQLLTFAKIGLSATDAALDARD